VLFLLGRGHALRYAAIGCVPVAWLLARSWGAADTYAACGAVAVVILAASAVNRPGPQGDKARELALAWMIAAALSTAVALVQYFGVEQLLGPFASPASVGEAYANLRQRNQFASLTVIGMSAILWQARREGAGLLSLALVALLAIGNAATTSRTGVVLLFLLLAASVVWPGAHKRDVVRCSIAALMAYAVASASLPWLLFEWKGVHAPDLWARVSGSAPCSSRWTLWGNVLRLIELRPWLGWGWGDLDYAHYMTLYPGERFCDILDNAHNLPLHIAVELGVPAAIVAVVAVLAVVLKARPWREADPSRQLAWCVLAVIAVHSFFEYPLWYGPFQIALGAALGLLWPSPAAPRPPSVRPAAFVLPGLLLALLVYAAWDYRRVSQIYLPPEARAPSYRDDPQPLIRDSILFRNQARFAELTLSTLTRENAAWTLETSLALLHYSPEPRVIEKVIESATMLGRDDLAVEHLARFRAAFPAEYAAWAAQHGQGAR
jgi:O-antigen ligase